jgi:hypothetical protein
MSAIAYRPLNFQNFMRGMGEGGRMDSLESIHSFIRYAFSRFQYGASAPPDSSRHSPPIHHNWSQLIFDVHPGPIGAAVNDAVNLQKSLFVYVFCPENPDCAQAETVLRADAVGQLVADRYLFYATSSTASDGYSILTGLNFRSLPLILLVHPAGRTLRESTIFVTHQGPISIATLLDYFTLDRRGNPDPIVRNQDEEFQAALIDAEQQQLAQIQTEGEFDLYRQTVAAQFESLPNLSANDNNVSKVRFRMPDNSQSERFFPENGAVAMLFVHVRFVLFPRRFVLLTGFPQMQIQEGEAAIGELCSHGQLLVYVQYSDD